MICRFHPHLNTLFLNYSLNHFYTITKYSLLSTEIREIISIKYLNSVEKKTKRRENGNYGLHDRNVFVNNCTKVFKSAFPYGNKVTNENAD